MVGNTMPAGAVGSATAARTTEAVASSEVKVAGKPELDISRVKFSVQFEVKFTDSKNQLARELAQKLPGWTATAVTNDCSHTPEKCRYGGYTIIRSPVGTLQDGTLDRLGEALDMIGPKVGNNPGKTAAMRITVDGSVLDDEGVTNLVNMFLANEAIIYRLSTAGGPGRTLADKQLYSGPPSTGNFYTVYGGGIYNGPQYRKQFPALRQISQTQSVSTWRSHLSNPHWGMNSSVGGHWEFRYFDTSFNVPSVQANVQLLLGMIKAAAEGRGHWDQVRPLLDTCNDEVSRKQWRAFVDTVAPAPIHALLEKDFIASGGRLQAANDEWIRQAFPKLFERGYRFEAPQADGMPATALTLQQVLERFDQKQAVNVSAPAKRGVPMTELQLGHLALIEAGNTSRLDASRQEDCRAAAALAMRGIIFEVSSTEVTGAMAAVLSDEPGRVTAVKNGERVPISHAAGQGLSMRIMSAVEFGPSEATDASIKALADAAQFAVSHGVDCGDREGQAARWSARIAFLLASGKLTAGSPGATTPIDSLDAFRDQVILPQRLNEIGAEQRATFEKMKSMLEGGCTFPFGKATVTGTSLALLELAGAIQSPATQARVRVSFPHWVMWKCWPRRSIRIDNIETLDRLSRKLKPVPAERLAS